MRLVGESVRWILAPSIRVLVKCTYPTLFSLGIDQWRIRYEAGHPVRRRRRLHLFSFAFVFACRIDADASPF